MALPPAEAAQPAGSDATSLRSHGQLDFDADPMPMKEVSLYSAADGAVPNKTAEMAILYDVCISPRREPSAGIVHEKRGASCSSAICYASYSTVTLRRGCGGAAR